MEEDRVIFMNWTEFWDTNGLFSIYYFANCHIQTRISFADILDKLDEKIKQSIKTWFIEKESVLSSEPLQKREIVMN